MNHRLSIALLLNVSLCAFALWSTVRALAPRWSRRPRARAALRAAVPLTVLATAALELGARRWSPLGGGAWRAPLALERAALVGSLFTGLALLAARVLSTLIPDAPSAAPRPDETPTPTVDRREALARGAAVGSAALATSAALLGGYKLRHDIAVTELEVFVDGLPPQLEGLTIVQLTDLHIGVFTGPSELRQIEEVVRRLSADHLVITGDIIDYSPHHVPDGMRWLSRLRARRGAFAVLGNHDHYTGAGRVTEGLRRAGIHPLVNTSVRLRGGAREGIVLAGVDDVIAQRLGSGRGPDLALALRDRDRDEPVILLAHNPVCFDIPAARRPALQLSGHTHGGQINPVGAMRAMLRYVAGRYEREGSLMYVSRGLGVTGPPVRIAAPPEIVRVALTGRRRVG